MTDRPNFYYFSRNNRHRSRKSFANKELPSRNGRESCAAPKIENLVVVPMILLWQAAINKTLPRCQNTSLQLKILHVTVSFLKNHQFLLLLLYFHCILTGIFDD